MKGENGFTFVEIIAVLVILGIVAAIAMPRYLNLAREAKTSAAKAQVAELKSTLDLAYGKKYISTSRAPETAAEVIVEAGFVSGAPANVGRDPDVWNVTLRALSTGATTVEINSRNGDAEYRAAGTWNLPH